MVSGAQGESAATLPAEPSTTTLQPQTRPGAPTHPAWGLQKAAETSSNTSLQHPLPSEYLWRDAEGFFCPLSSDRITVRRRFIQEKWIHFFKK